VAEISRLTKKTNLPYIIRLQDGQRIILFTTNNRSCEIWFPSKEIRADLKKLLGSSYTSSSKLYRDISTIKVFTIIRDHGGLCEKHHPKGMPVTLNHGLTEIELISQNFDFAI